ncbi:hypothetical protein C7408_1132 [Paraburkholderia caballeronis]|nr:hypothetical protein C7408_1132 [Paraburkholderia caballeronis]TDV14318.1 hypothetical protein C7406_114155 [Paraburkholderia caballeronis]TDV23484.1 hypothetical protein C7404_113156 [Paraburkholderia caballeronis]
MGEPQLTGPLEQQRSKLQCRTGNYMAVVGSNIAQQLSKLLRISDSWVMTTADRWESACTAIHKILGWFQNASIDCVLIHMLNRLAYPHRGFKIAPLFDAVQATHNFGRFDLLHRKSPHPGKHVQL